MCLIIDLIYCSYLAIESPISLQCDLNVICCTTKNLLRVFHSFSFKTRKKFVYPKGHRYEKNIYLENISFSPKFRWCQPWFLCLHIFCQRCFCYVPLCTLRCIVSKRQLAFLFWITRFNSLALFTTLEYVIQIIGFPSYFGVFLSNVQRLCLYMYIVPKF